MFKKAKKIFACLLVFSLMCSVYTPISVSAAASVEQLQQFDMEQVKITDQYYVNAFNKEVAYLRAIDPNRLLVGFKKAAGLSTNYSYYGGWENNTMIQGHTMGHYMSALAQAYKNTKSDTTVNADLKSRIDLIISELQACQNKNGNGYVFATPVNQFDVIEGKASGSSWVPWYTMHKIMAGLIEIYQFEGNKNALTVASNLGNWIYNRVKGWDSATQAKVLGIEYGGMNDCMYELYKLTGNSNHLTAAHKFDDNSLFNTIASGKNILANQHANTTIPKFIGALNRYRTLGTTEASYLTAAQQFWTIVLRDHTYVTGGNSQDERFRTAGKLDAFRDNVNNETCNVHNMLKLSRELFKVTGDVKYADYYENAFINEIMASQNPETGMATYFKAMGTGYFKVFSSQFDHFWCCTGTGMENFTKLNDSLYYHNSSDLYVNMYLSSTLDWSEKNFSLTQQDNIPASDIALFTVNKAPDAEVKIKFRSPSWVAAGQNVTVKVNGTPINIAKVNGYLDVNRVWKAGDTVELTMPMDVKVSRLTDSQNTVAFTYGPIVLSAGLGTASMTTQGHGVGVLKATKNVTIKETININTNACPSIDSWLGNINSNLVRTPGKVEFTLKNTDEDNNLKFTPHYQRYKDRYGIYFKLGTYAGAKPDNDPGKTVFYQNTNFGGTSVSLNPGSYTTAQLSAAGIADNWVSSLKVPEGYTVEIYDNDNLGGTKWTFTADNSDLAAASCNDKMSSVKIYANVSQKKYGDINNDGTIDTIDFALLKQYLLGKSADINIDAADLDGDKSVTVVDFAFLKKYLLGQITEFPVSSGTVK